MFKISSETVLSLLHNESHYLTNSSWCGGHTVDEDSGYPAHGGKGQTHAEPLSPAGVMVGAVIRQRREAHPTGNEYRL